MAPEENKRMVRRRYDELRNGRNPKVADGLISEEGFGYDAGLTVVACCTRGGEVVGITGSGVAA